MLDALRLRKSHMDTGRLDKLESHHDTQLRIRRSWLRAFGAFPRQESLPCSQCHGSKDEQDSGDCRRSIARGIGHRDQNPLLRVCPFRGSSSAANTS